MGSSHDVRRLAPCLLCGKLVSKNDALRGPMHGRCFAYKYGVLALMSCPREQLMQLRLDDIGPKVMHALLALDDAGALLSMRTMRPGAPRQRQRSNDGRGT